MFAKLKKKFFKKKKKARAPRKTKEISGIIFREDIQRWQVSIGRNKKQYYFGTYETREEAVEIRKEINNHLDDLEAFREEVKKRILLNKKRSKRKVRVDKYEITQEDLKKLITYNPKTGVFRYKNNNKKIKNFQKDGMNHFSYKGNRYLLHRLAFLYMTGHIPKLIVHKDGNKKNNKWKNLINASRLPEDKKEFDIPGVTYEPKSKMWYVHYFKNSKQFHLGTFSKFEDALSIRKKAEQNHDNFEEFYKNLRAGKVRNKNDAKLTQEQLKELVIYNPDTGVFTWKENHPKYFHKKGDILGKLNPNKMIYIHIGKNKFLAHRLAFLYMKGKIPREVSHVDGDNSNNKWSNLKSKFGD